MFSVVCLAAADAAAVDVSIGRADSHGSEVNPAYIDAAGVGGPGDVAASAHNLYWVRRGEAGHDAIARASLNGLNVDRNFITGLTSVGGLTANDRFLYWGGASIGRAQLDGTAVEPTFMTPSGGADDVAATQQYVYWTSDVGIGRANVDGSGADSGFIDTGVTTAPDSQQRVQPPTDVAVNSSHAFWSYSGDDLGSPVFAIGRSKLDGSGVETVLRGGGLRGDYYGSLGASDKRVFVSVGSGLNEHRIGFFPAKFASDQPSCCLPGWPTTDKPDVTDPARGVTVAGGQVYWTHLAEGGLNCSLDRTHRDQRQRGRKIVFEVWFNACEEVRVRAAGLAKVAGGRYRLKTTIETIAPADSKLAVTPRRKDRQEILSALRNGGLVRANITVRMTDTAGISSKRSYRVQLTHH
jgi:hypothetical protein